MQRSRQFAAVGLVVLAIALAAAWIPGAEGHSRQSGTCAALIEDSAYPSPSVAARVDGGDASGRQVGGGDGASGRYITLDAAGPRGGLND